MIHYHTMAVIQQIKDVVELDEKLRLLKTNFGYMEPLSRQIDQQFQYQIELPEAIAKCLTEMSNHLKEGQQLINRANRQRRRCFGCCLLCNPNLSPQITDWKVRFDQIFHELVEVLLSRASTVIAAVIKQIKDVVELDESRQLLNTDFGYRIFMLLDIDQQFQEQQIMLPRTIELCLTVMSHLLKEGQQLINRANRRRRWCLCCCLHCSPNLFTQIRNWKMRFDKIFHELVGVLLGSFPEQVKGLTRINIDAVMKQTKDVVQLDESLQLLNTDFGYEDFMLRNIDQQFHEQQKRSVAIEVCLMRMSHHLEEAQQLINRANRQRRRCVGCCLLCNPNLFTQIRDWKMRFDKIFHEFVGIEGIEIIASSVIARVIQQIKDVVQLDEKLRLLKINFRYMEPLLRQIHQLFQEQQRSLPEAIEVRVTAMGNHLKEGQELINRANRQRRRCFGCYLLCNPNLSPQITDWKTRFGELLQDLSISADIPQIVSAAASQADLRQPVPDSGFVGWTIESAQKQLQEWVTQPHPEARMIGVYGMGGVGKTSLLKLLYNHFLKVSGVFDVLIWVTVSQNCPIEKLQASIATTLKLKPEEISASLEKKRFLLVLDDMWRRINLEEVGVKFGYHKCSKVLVSSRSREVIVAMGAREECSLKIQPLYTEEGWELFRTRAFTNGVVPGKSIEAIARNIASECGGLPLALNAVAAAMGLRKKEEEWSRALKLMRTVDPSFRTSNSTIDEELYKRLKWSYDDLTKHELKICFLYCAVFPEDAQIHVERLLKMWSAEKLVTGMDAGHEYIDALVSRGLFEYVVRGELRGEMIKLGNDDSTFLYPEKAVKVHNVLRHLAIDIGRSEENWFFGTGQHLQSFPTEDETRDCKRISVAHNDIQDLPPDLICSQLVSLVLANNEKIREVPGGFLSTARSLKVLDLSGTLITSLPTSLGQLGRLELLNLTGCYLLNELPYSTGNLSSLRFLNLQYCQSLKWLPEDIENLRNLEHLNLEGCDGLWGIPRNISRLTLLTKLGLPLKDTCAMRVKGLANLSNLMELSAVVEPEIKEGTRPTWTEMRRLSLWIDGYYDIDDGVEYILPCDIEKMNKLESFYLKNYKGVSLPDCISRFQNLRDLELSSCTQLRALPACEIGNEIAGAGFPVLKKLRLVSLDNLESVVTSEETMSELEEIEISLCSSFKRLGTKKLPALKKLEIDSCHEFEALDIGSGGLPMLEELWLEGLRKLEITVGSSGVINDGVMPKLKELRIWGCPSLKTVEKLSNLRRLFIGSCDEWRQLKIGRGGFPMLETLELWRCANLESMVGPSDVWNEETMPKLQVVRIRGCPLLRRLPRGMEKLSNLKQIEGQLEWWQNIIWDNDYARRIISPRFTEIM